MTANAHALFDPAILDDGQWADLGSAAVRVRVNEWHDITALHGFLPIATR
jgi:hypothetical protein